MKSFTRRTAAAALAVSLVLPSAVWAAEGSDAVLDSQPLYEIETISGTGELGSTDGGPDVSAYRQPVGVAVNAKGQIVVTDAGNQKIRTITGTTVATTAGVELGLDDYGFVVGGKADGSADESVFQSPSGIAIGKDGTIVIADTDNHAIRAIAQGSVTTIAGNGLIGSADGKGSDATFNSPSDVAITADGIIYVADTLNHAIRKIENGVVTTLNKLSERAVEYYPGAIEPAGDYKDGSLAEALFNEPSGLALDAKGNLYVSDTGNQRIRYIDLAAGTVKTVAGGGTLGSTEAYVEGEYVDGKARDARFHAPRGLTVTPDGGVLIADSLNHVIRYLKGGEVTTVAGVPNETGKSDGVAAYGGLNVPTDVAYIGDGAFVVADHGNNRVRVVKPYDKPAGLAGEKIEIVYGANVLETDADPIVKSGTTFVPVRVISESLDFKVDYGDGGVTTLTKGEMSYKITNGSTSVELADGSKLTLPQAPFELNGRTYLPVRFFAEQVDLDVKWLSEEKAVLLRNKIAADA